MYEAIGVQAHFSGDDLYRFYGLAFSAVARPPQPPEIFISVQLTRRCDRRLPA